MNRSKFVAAAFAALLLSGCGNKTVSPDGTPSSGPTTALGRWFSVTHPVTIPQGTVLQIRTQVALSTHEARAGETVLATLVSPLIVAGQVIAPQGAPAQLVVAESNPGGRVKGRAILGLRLVSLQIAGSNVPVASDISWHQAYGTKKKDAAKIAILSGVGAAIGALAGGGKGAAIGAGAGGGAGTALVLSTHGDPAVVPAESVLPFHLAQPLTVTVKN